MNGDGTIGEVVTALTAAALNGHIEIVYSLLLDEATDEVNNFNMV